MDAVVVEDVEDERLKQNEVVGEPGHESVELVADQPEVAAVPAGRFAGPRWVQKELQRSI